MLPKSTTLAFDPPWVHAQNGAKRTRTADIFGVNEALYQLSYSPFSTL